MEEESIGYRADLGWGNNVKKNNTLVRKTQKCMRLNRSFEGFEKGKRGQESGWLLVESRNSRKETEKKCECSEWLNKQA